MAATTPNMTNPTAPPPPTSATDGKTNTQPSPTASSTQPSQTTAALLQDALKALDSLEQNINKFRRSNEEIRKHFLELHDILIDGVVEEENEGDEGMEVDGAEVITVVMRMFVEDVERCV